MRSNDFIRSNRKLNTFHEEFAEIINPPQYMILAVCTICKAIKLNEEKIQETNVIKSTLSVDHRVLDGADVARFLNSIRKYLEEPESLIKE